MSRTRQQGGWIVGFVVVGIVLVLALLGGMYFLKHMSGSGNSVADKTNQAIEDTKKTVTGPVKQKADQNSQSDTTKKQDEAKSSETDSSASADNENTATDSTDTATKQSEANNTSAATDSTASNSQDAQSTSVTTEEKDNSSAANLPQTGPESTLLSLLAATLLTFAGASYLRSRSIG